MSAFGGKAYIPYSGSTDAHFWADTVYAKLEGHDGVMLFPKGSATLTPLVDATATEFEKLRRHLHELASASAQILARREFDLILALP